MKKRIWIVLIAFIFPAHMFNADLELSSLCEVIYLMEVFVICVDYALKHILCRKRGVVATAHGRSAAMAGDSHIDHLAGVLLVVLDRRA